jgi:pimeloyl-ACP methyl ester carboxylesterase
MISPARTAAFLLVLAAGAGAQQAVPRLDAVDHAERQRRIALTGELGLPPLLPVRPDSPLDTLYFADRVPPPPPQDAPAPGDGGAPTMVDGFIPASVTGTGIGEIFKYQIPGSYDPGADPVPLVIGYHGFGSSASSVAAQTTLDEECNARGWFYMAPTGLDDQLFGSDPSQANTEAALQFLLDNFAIDADRIYMVGFSMGGGVCANFAARRRDPDGIMIAALGVVSGTFDWTLTWFTSDSTVQVLLENPFNFGGTPFQFPFPYQASSGLYFSSGSYPPLPGVLEFGRSMALNLGTVPTYVTWDLDDTLPEVVSEEPVFQGVLAALGGTVVSKPVTGTPSPKHSWAVLDEADLFDFFDGKVVQRYPAVIEALAEKDKAVGWIEVQQAAGGDFTRLDALAVPGSLSASASGVTNARRLTLDLGAAGLSGAGPFHVAGSSADATGFELAAAGTADPPAWMLETVGGTLAQDFEGDPGDGSAWVPVAGFGTRQVDLQTDDAYTAALTTTPEPALVGQNVSIDVDGSPLALDAWVLIGLQRAIGQVKGQTLLVQMSPPALTFFLDLDASGDVSLAGPLPNDPVLSGVEIVVQAITVRGPLILEMSNLWGLDIQ